MTELRIGVDGVAYVFGGGCMCRLNDLQHEPSSLSPQAACRPKWPGAKPTAPVGARIVDDRPPPIAKGRQALLAGLFLGDDVALDDGAVQSGCAQHAPNDAVEEAGHGRLSSHVEHQVGPTPPVAVEVSEAPPSQLHLV